MHGDADRRAGPRSRQRHSRLGHFQQNAPCNVHGGIGVARGKDQKLVATEPCADVALARACADRIGHARDDGVAGDVAAHVVDHLQAVDIDEEHRVALFETPTRISPSRPDVTRPSTLIPAITAVRVVRCSAGRDGLGRDARQEVFDCVHRAATIVQARESVTNGGVV